MERAKDFWLTEGDPNNKFFHASASSRRKTNYIPFLESDSGVKVNDKDGICNMVKDYFSDIFRGDQQSSSTHFTEESMCMSDSHNQMLVAELSFVGFTNVVKQMHPDKASGPNGQNPAFFQQFWHVFCKEVYTCCKDWLHTNSFPKNLNDTMLCLFPKKRMLVV